MVYDGMAKKVLKKMKRSLVVRKGELIDLLREDAKNPRDVVNSVTKMLIQNGLITPIYASESTFAITKKGMKHLE